MLCWHREFANRIYFLLLAEISSIIGSGEWILKSICHCYFFADNEQKSVLARDLGDCRENLGNVQSTFLIVSCP